MYAGNFRWKMFEDFAVKSQRKVSIPGKGRWHSHSVCLIPTESPSAARLLFFCQHYFDTRTGQDGHTERRGEQETVEYQLWERHH